MKLSFENLPFSKEGNLGLRLRAFAITAITLSSLIVSCATTDVNKLDNVNSDYYIGVLPKLLAKDTVALDTIDFARLRFSYMLYSYETEAPSCEKYLDEMYRASKENRFVHAAQWADSVLAIDMTHIEPHMIIAYYQKKYNEDYSFHDKMFRKLTESIKSIGDGKSPETAYIVAHVEEEQQLIFSEDMSIIDYKVINSNGDYIDIFQCETPDGKRVTLYFDRTFLWNLKTIRAKRSLFKVK